MITTHLPNPSFLPKEFKENTSLDILIGSFLKKVFSVQETPSELHSKLVSIMDDTNELHAVVEFTILTSEKAGYFIKYDSISWILLHLICLKHLSINAIVSHSLYQWIQDPRHSEAALPGRNDVQTEARLFLLGHNDEPILTEEYRNDVIFPLFSIEDPWIYLTLLTSPLLNHEDLDRIKQLPHPFVERIFLELSSFQTYVLMDATKKNSLVTRLFDLLSTQEISEFSEQALENFVKISSRMITFSDEQTISLAKISGALLTKMNVSAYVEEQLSQEIGGKSPVSDHTMNAIKNDKQAEYFRKVSNRFITCIKIPGVLDHVVQLPDSEKIHQNLAEVSVSISSFLRDGLSAVWKQDSSARVCNDATIDWLLNLPLYKDLALLKFDHLTLQNFIVSLLQTEDIYTLEKIVQLLLGRSQILHMNTADSYKIRPILLLTNQFQYQKDTDTVDSQGNMQKNIEYILGINNFHIGDEYPYASAAFKSFNSVQTSYALFCIFSGQSAPTIYPINNAVASHELSTRYQEPLDATLKNLIAHDQPHTLTDDSQKIKEIHRLIKSSTDTEFPNKLRFHLTYRMVLASEAAFTGMKGFMGGGKKKNKFLFIQFILKILPVLNEAIHFTKLAYFYIHQTRQQALISEYLQNLQHPRYVGQEDEIKKSFSEWTNDITDHQINKFLIETIFASDSTASKTAESFAKLPEDFLLKLFENTEITLDVLCEKGGITPDQRRSRLGSATSDFDETAITQNPSSMYNNTKPKEITAENNVTTNHP